MSAKVKLRATEGSVEGPRNLRPVVEAFAELPLSKLLLESKAAALHGAAEAGAVVWQSKPA